MTLPEVGLGAVFLISLLASTLLPLGSEPALLAYVALTPSAVWPALAVATLGNTLGGVLTYWMGVGAKRAVTAAVKPSQPDSAVSERVQGTATGRWQRHAHSLAQRFGAPVLLLSWLPLVGDPLCAVAGWLRLPFGPCLFYIALGKFARYALICGVLLGFFIGS